MPNDQWYYVLEGQQCGPVAAQSLRRLVASGRLAPATLVWREGLTDWAPATQLDALLGPASLSEAVGAEPKRARRHVMDGLLLGVRAAIPAPLLERADSAFLALGRLGFGIGMLGVLIFVGLYAAWRAPRGTATAVLALGGATVLLLAGLHAITVKFGNPARRLLMAMPSRLATTAFLDCWALLALLATILAFAAALWSAVHFASAIFVFLGAATLVIGGYSACLALHPRTLAIGIATDADPSEEAVGLAAFFMKLGVRLVPVVFGLAVGLGGIGTLIGNVYLFRSHLAAQNAATPRTDASPDNPKPVTSPEVAEAQAFLWMSCSLTAMSLGGLLPLIGYVIFCVWFLLIDMARTQMLMGGQPDPFRVTDLVGRSSTP